MNGLVDLAHPWALTLAFVILFLIWAQRRSLADMTPAQRKVCFALRTFIMLLLVLALAKPIVRSAAQRSIYYRFVIKRHGRLEAIVQQGNLHLEL